jgi:acyl-CoA thioesterase FadM
MKTFLLQLKPIWPKAVLWSFITSVVFGLLFWTFCHLPATPPEMGFSSDSEVKQYDEIVAAQHKDYRVTLSMLAVIPLSFLSLTAFCKLEGVFIGEKRYLVLSMAVVGTCVTASVQMRADRSMIDDLNHVNYIASVSNIDCCREALMEAAGWDLLRLRDEHHLAFMMRAVETKYRSQIRRGDLITINGKMEQKGGVKVVLSFELFAEDRQAVTAVFTMPMVSLKTGKVEPLPDWLWPKNPTGV